jgi:electron transfer flavoprotein beta subunit
MDWCKKGVKVSFIHSNDTGVILNILDSDLVLIKLDADQLEIPAFIEDIEPFISFASHLEMASDNVAIIKRDMDGGTETIQVNTPFVVSAAKGMAEQRIPNMKGIMTAKSKPLNVVTPQAYSPKISIVSHELPPAKKAVQYIDPENMAELARLLREEAKVI